MRIVINALSQVGAGSRTYLANILPRLAHLDNGSTYVVLWPSGKEVPPSLSENKKMSFLRIHVPQKPALPRFLYEQFLMPIAARRGDVLFAPVDIGPLFCPCPVVLAIRNPNAFFNIPRSFTARARLRLKRILTGLSARRASRVIFVSKHSEQYIARQIGVPPERTQVIYHGIDHDKFQIAKAKSRSSETAVNIPGVESYILSISTITPHKNYEVLLRGYALLPEQLRSKYALVVVGRVADPDYYRLLQELALKLGIEEATHFIGEFPYDRIEELYWSASVYALPSFLETFGHTLVEAMASGVPIVASDVSCIPEIVGEGGLLFDPYDPGDLAQKLEHVLTRENLRNRLTTAGQKRVQAFSWDETTRNLIEILQSVGA